MQHIPLYRFINNKSTYWNVLRAHIFKFYFNTITFHIILWDNYIHIHILYRHILLSPSHPLSFDWLLNTLNLNYFFNSIILILLSLTIFSFVTNIFLLNIFTNFYKLWSRNWVETDNWILSVWTYLFSINVF